jgi:hypothetical protein
MPEPLRLNLRLGAALEGSRPYVVYVDVTNTTPANLLDLEVEPEVYPGVLSVSQTSDESLPDELQSTRAALTRELEAQVRRAWTSLRFRKTSFTRQILFAYARTLSPNITAVPTWATEALKIRDREDLDRLEKEIISQLPESSRIRMAFGIDKDKLIRVLQAVDDRDKTNSSSNDLRPLSPMAQGETRTFTFRGKAPFLWNSTDLTFRFSARFRPHDSTMISVSSVDRPFSALCSPSSVPIGTLAGAVTGFLVRGCLVVTEDWTSRRPWLSLLGCLLLSLIIAALSRNTPDTRRSFRVENFVGGFVLGALVGLFSDQFLAFAGHVVSGLAPAATTKP